MTQASLSRFVMLSGLTLYTAIVSAPFLWTAVMSLRTTTEISQDHFGWPTPPHFYKFYDAWVNSNYYVYFFNSLIIVVSSVVAITIIGSMAAYCFARFKFRFNRALYFMIFSTIIFPPQITIISLFQILSNYNLIDSKFGLVLVYVSLQLPLTIYILESFFRQIPADLFDAARIDGYSEHAIFWKIGFPVALPALSTTVILNFILLWNEFLFAVVLITEESNRTLPLGIQRFMGDQLEDIGMIATGLIIAIIPVIVIYTFFSERIIKGMTDGAVK